jgi:hypothetical protein
MKKVLIILLSLWTITSCDLVVDKDITSDKISLLSPADKDTNDAKVQYFWWEENKQIEQYRLQIVHPSFENPSIMYVDTILKGKFNYSRSLIPDAYQWRVRGENNSFKTSYVTRSFKVDSSYNISQFPIVLTSPQDNAQLDNNTTTYTLRWEGIPLATRYEVTIETADGTIYNDPGTGRTNTNQYIATNLVSKIDKAVTYRWTVTGINDKSNTQTLPNVGRTFTIKKKESILVTP